MMKPYKIMQAIDEALWLDIYSLPMVIGTSCYNMVFHMDCSVHNS